MRTVCPDTSYLVALYEACDSLHAAASGIQEALRGHGLRFIYLDCVVTEILNVLARRARQRRVRPASGWALNFHDALILAAWQEIGFDALLSFDEDFDSVSVPPRIGSAAHVHSWLAGNR